jgi:hypothetical protein
MRYFLGFLVSIGLIILVFVLVLRGFGGKPEPTRNPLTDYANSNTIVRMTVDGPIVADQQHQAYRITVGQSETRIETLQGYEYDAIDTKIYDNNQEGYANFLRAIDLAGYTKGVADADGQAQDERGVCANGNRFIFEIINGTSQIERYWSTSCGNNGTFKGNTQAIKQLFDRQIPVRDFSRETGHLNL